METPFAYGVLQKGLRPSIRRHDLLGVLSFPLCYMENLVNLNTLAVALSPPCGIHPTSFSTSAYMVESIRTLPLNGMLALNRYLYFAAIEMGTRRASA